MVDSNQKFCTHCGAELDDGAAFCKNCGAKSDESDAFCTKCGAEFEPGTTYCKSCGAAVGDTAAKQAESEYIAMEIANANSRLSIVGICCAIYTVIALIVGISIIMSADQIVNQMVADAQWADTVKTMVDAGVVKDGAELENFFRSLFSIGGYASVVMALFALVPAITSFTKKGYIFGLIGLVVCTVMSTTYIIGLILGIIFIVMYCKSKIAFTVRQ